MITSVFKRVVRIVSRDRSDASIAIPVVLRHITCPYCSSIFGVMTLGKVSFKLDKRMVIESGGRTHPNPRFRESHLANPIRCPDCGREFVVFVGVQYDFERGSVEDLDVKIALPDDPFVRQVSVWPHKGLVMTQVLEFSPFTVKIYDSMEHFEQYNKDRLSDIAAASLDAMTNKVKVENAGLAGVDRDSEPKTVDLANKRIL